MTESFLRMGLIAVVAAGVTAGVTAGVIVEVAGLVYTRSPHAGLPSLLSVRRVELAKLCLLRLFVF